ncbi:hypothetical protein KDW55_18900 [Burkholderia sp. AU19243]|uniref:hypothetical protein n=1 Tax=Burkholderia sp. AU19243 TaxID=2824810 RepID=UPI001B8E2A6A|nr:hypothetical protein [Burkholderia sp. AU19243]MBR8145544.1 hypothetical protein [Burkholderia vietnamiensis]MBR8365390.1 hypothetical protein [Burkholderia sp. AU19243]
MGEHDFRIVIQTGETPVRRAGGMHPHAARGHVRRIDKTGPGNSERGGAAVRAISGIRSGSPGERAAGRTAAASTTLCCQLIHYPDGSIVEAPIAMWLMGVFFCSARFTRGRTPD